MIRSHESIQESHFKVVKPKTKWDIFKFPPFSKQNYKFCRWLSYALGQEDMLNPSLVGIFCSLRHKLNNSIKMKILTFGGTVCANCMF